MILNLVSRVYKEYIIYYYAVILFLKVSDCLPPFLKVPPVSAFQKPKQSNKPSLQSASLSHLEFNPFLSIFLTILQNLNLH